MDVAGPPGCGADLVPAGTDRLVLVITALVGHQAGATVELVLLRRVRRIVVVVAALGIGMPDVEYGAGQRPTRVEAPHPSSHQQRVSWLERRRGLATKRRAATIIRSQDVRLRGRPVGWK